MLKNPFFALLLAALPLAAVTPTVSSVSPNSGPTSGGTVVTITGTGFTGASNIAFGAANVAEGGYIVVDDKTITTTTPPGALGAVSVVVTTPGGGNGPNSLFTYVAAAPTVGGISPNTGPTTGGTNVSIVGSGFTGATGVTLGGVPANNVKVQSDGRMTAISGAGAAGTGSVVVTTALGSNPPNKLFTYLVPGTIQFTQVLGQPTDQTATLNVQANAAIDIYYEFGAESGIYTNTTTMVTAAPDPYTKGYYVAQIALSGLQIDTTYFYRIRYRASGSSGDSTPGTERSFRTQRLPGSSFIFTVQGDSHPERVQTMFHSDLYNQTLSAVAAEHPDFHITSGDDFSVDILPTPYTQDTVTGRYALQLPYLDLLNTSAVFLGTGNHEETSLSNYNLKPDNTNSNMVPIWAQNARNLYYSVPGPNDPITGSFYTGNLTTMPGIGGLLRDYYAWQWGDALFVVIDPYWSSPAQVDTGLGGHGSTTPKSSDLWSVTHGDAQYNWLKQTLEQSTAKWKFVFAHHVMGTGRGGVEVATQYEWGGADPKGKVSFTGARPTWPEPIHQLMVANNVTIFFQGHDHVFAHQQLDGITYQALPNPADNTYTAFNADAYKTGEVFPDAGYVKVTVAPDSIKLDYIREFLPQDERPPDLVSGMVQFSYMIPANQ